MSTLWLDNASTRITPEQGDNKKSFEFCEHRLPSYLFLSSISWHKFCRMRNQLQGIQAKKRQKVQRETRSLIPADNDAITGEGEIAQKANGSNDRRYKNPPNNVQYFMAIFTCKI